MDRMRIRAARVLASLGVAAALGFGAAQAAAAPRGAETAEVCGPVQCYLDCRANEYNGGICIGSGCRCY